MSEYPPTPPEPPAGPAPGWWQASDGNWYPPDQQPGYGAPPPGYGAPGYGAPAYGYGQPTAYGYGYTVPVAKTTNGLAIAALVLGCLQFFLWVLSGIPAIICGHIALSQIRRTGQEGRGMAIAGLIIGYLGLVLFVAFVVLVIAAADEIDNDGFQLENGIVRW
jgi:hypothetical protein